MSPTRPRQPPCHLRPLPRVRRRAAPPAPHGLALAVLEHEGLHSRSRRRAEVALEADPAPTPARARAHNGPRFSRWRPETAQRRGCLRKTRSRCIARSATREAPRTRRSCSVRSSLRKRTGRAPVTSSRRACARSRSSAMSTTRCSSVATSPGSTTNSESATASSAPRGKPSSGARAWQPASRGVDAAGPRMESGRRGSVAGGARPARGVVSHQSRNRRSCRRGRRPLPAGARPPRCAETGGGSNAPLARGRALSVDRPPASLPS